jgi:hypothetical protein
MCLKLKVMQKEIKKEEIKAGDYFKAFRPIHGETVHKCVRIKDGSGGDFFYHGWLVDERNIMIDPKYATKIG